MYECEIGDNTFIGPFVEIQKNVKIGKNCRIQSHSFICENVKISDNCFIGHGVNFINDKFRNNKIEKNPKKFLKTYIKKNVKIGSNATILPSQLRENTVIKTGSVVTKNCMKNSVNDFGLAKKEMISVINYDGGNIKSILNILKRCNIDYYLTSKEKK